MRIALITDGIYPYVIGGMQKHSFYLAKYFAVNKVEIDLYHTAENIEEAELLSCFTEEEKKYIYSIIVPLPELDKFPGHYLREMYAYSRLMYKELKKNKSVDFVYVQGLCGMNLFENKTELRTPIGVNLHGLEMFQKAANIKSKVEQFLFRKPVLKVLKNADVVFSLGGKLTELLINKSIPAKKIIQLPVGIDETWIRKGRIEAYPPIKFIFVGRYERRKGILELNKVLNELIKKYSFEFYFIGPIPTDKQIKSAQIHYFGSLADIDQIKAILKKTDVLVCPSYSEGMPNVILEAMASGLAVIATDVGAVSEQVSSENGLLIEAGNINSLRNALLTFINIPEAQLIQMKQNSIEIIKQRFMWDSIILRTIKEIENSINITKNRTRY